MRMSKKDGVATTLTSSSTTRAITGQSSWLPRNLRTRGLLLGAGLARDDLEDVADRDVVVAPVVDLAAVAHHEQAVAQPEDLLQLGGDEDDGHALAGQLCDELLDLRLGADVDAPGGLVEDQHLGLRDQPAGQQDLLLV